MILGHAALAVAGKRTVFRAVSLPVLLAATYGPDLIDKTGMLLLGTSSKGIGHTLLTYVALAAMLALASLPRRRGRPGPLVLAVLLLWLSHLVLDLTDGVIFFWPWLGPLPVTDPYDLSEGFLRFYSGHGNHLVLAFDVASMALAFFTCVMRRRPATAGAGNT